MVGGKLGSADMNTNTKDKDKDRQVAELVQALRDVRAACIEKRSRFAIDVIAANGLHRAGVSP
jgi:hypothetical protein